MSKQKDRELIMELKHILQDIPLPHVGHGTKTASIEGAISYAIDMAKCRPHIQTILSYLLGWQFSWSDKEGAETDLKEARKQVKEYIDKRKSEYWK